MNSLENNASQGARDSDSEAESTRMLPGVTSGELIPLSKPRIPCLTKQGQGPLHHRNVMRNDVCK